MIKSFLQHYLRSWRHHGVTQIATMTSLTMAFSFFLFSVLVSSNLNRIITLWGDRPELTVFLNEEVKPSQVQAFQKQIQTAVTGIKDIEFVSSSDALKRFKEEFADVAPELLTENLMESPFPDSLIVRLKEGIHSPEDYDVLVAKAGAIQSLPGVSEVSYGKNWVENYSNFVGALKIFSWGLLILLMVACQFMIANTIRASVAHRKQEIQIKELLGAESIDVRGPFLFEGWMSSALAGLLSLLAMGSFFIASKWILQRQFPLLRLSERLEYFTGLEMAGLFALFSLVGLIGSYFVVRNVASGEQVVDV